MEAIDASKPKLIRGFSVPPVTYLKRYRLLRLAASLGDAKTVSKLAKEGPVDEPNKKGWTALMYAAQSGYERTCQILLNHGADPMKANSNGETSLILASSWGHECVIDVLLDHCSNVGKFGISKAMRSNNRKLLLNYQANDGKTALHHAIIANQIGCILLLKERGANFEIGDKRGITPSNLLTDQQKNELIIKSMEVTQRDAQTIERKI